MSKRFTDLERDGKIDKIPSNRAEVERLHAIVARDAATAEELRERNRDWALAIAYNALLQACLALMRAHGYRPRGEGQHVTAIESARTLLFDHETLFDRLDRLRRRRHGTVYGVVGQISTADVESALELARQLIPALGVVAQRAIAEREGKKREGR